MIINIKGAQETAITALAELMNLSVQDTVKFMLSIQIKILLLDDAPKKEIKSLLEKHLFNKEA